MYFFYYLSFFIKILNIKKQNCFFKVLFNKYCINKNNIDVKLY